MQMAYNVIADVYYNGRVVCSGIYLAIGLPSEKDAKDYVEKFRNLNDFFRKYMRFRLQEVDTDNIVTVGIDWNFGKCNRTVRCKAGNYSMTINACLNDYQQLSKSCFISAPSRPERPVRLCTAKSRCYAILVMIPKEYSSNSAPYETWIMRDNGRIEYIRPTGCVNYAVVQLNEGDSIYTVSWSYYVHLFSYLINISGVGGTKNVELVEIKNVRYDNGRIYAEVESSKVVKVCLYKRVNSKCHLIDYTWGGKGSTVSFGVYGDGYYCVSTYKGSVVDCREVE